MRYPSKITSYRESVLHKMIIILDVISKSDRNIFSLYEETHKYFINVEEFIDVIDCLYALNKIEINKQKEVIRYVN